MSQPLNDHFAFLKFWDTPENRQEAPHGTPQNIPQKPVNPKLFFANERTFLHWMQCKDYDIIV
jgi:hypothetical protein